MPVSSEVSAKVDRLASLDAGPYPVISLYLDLTPDDRGRDRFEPFVRAALPERLRTYPEGPERESLDADAEKIRALLEDIDRSANGLALFACNGAGLFEPILLAAPVGEHQLYVSDRPHLYPVARILDAYPRYAVLVADTQAARLLVVALNSVERVESVEGVKTKRHKAGGWSQARYQRHVDNFREQHAKEAVEALTRIVRAEGIAAVIIGGDEVIVPLLTAELPGDVADRVVDTVRLDIRAPEHEILRTSMDALQRHDHRNDRERVEELLDVYRAGGLATVGVESVTRALEMGQVLELVVPATVGAPQSPGGSPQPSGVQKPLSERTAEALLQQARQTAASIRFIEDASLLDRAGGVGAFLRFLL